MKIKLKKLFMSMFNGLLTDDYFVNSIKILLSEHSLLSNNESNRTKIRLAIYSWCRNNYIYEYNVICDESNNQNLSSKLNIELVLKPTILSSYRTMTVTATLSSWGDKMISLFTEQDLIKHHSLDNIQASFI